MPEGPLGAPRPFSSVNITVEYGVKKELHNIGFGHEDQIRKLVDRNFSYMDAERVHLFQTSQDIEHPPYEIPLLEVIIEFSVTSLDTGEIESVGDKIERHFGEELLYTEVTTEPRAREGAFKL